MAVDGSSENGALLGAFHAQTGVEVRATGVRPATPHGLDAVTAQGSSQELRPSNGDSEVGYFFNGGSGDTQTFVQRLELPSARGQITGFEICYFVDSASALAPFEIEFVAYAASGSRPGGLLGSHTASPAEPLTGGVCLLLDPLSSTMEVATSAEQIFVGARFRASAGGDLQVAIDNDGSQAGPGWARRNDGSWEPMTASHEAFFDFRNLAFAIFYSDTSASQDPPDTSACIVDPTTLCLQGGRFEVVVDYLLNNGTRGQLKMDEYTPDSGLGYFSNPDNLEFAVKVLNACGRATARFWVFAAGMTNQELSLRVRDSNTGEVREYSSPLGTPFVTITDTDAFSTCP